MNKYKDKNIWIIGASFGIGEELYLQLTKSGANLAISARSQEDLQKLTKDNPGHLAIKMDITDKNSIYRAFSQIEESWKKIDLIIFCAGTYQPMNIDNFNLEKCQNIINVNFIGFINFFDCILPSIKTQQIKHLAVISSVAGYFGMNNSFGYGASKAALSNFVESLHLELKKYGTKVQLINPGFVKTRLTSQNNFKMPFLINTQKAANIILKEIPKNKFEIFFPKTFIGIMKFIRLMPYKINLAILSKIK
jgi:short-subunit dehydrogenase